MLIRIEPPRKHVQLGLLNLLPWLLCLAVPQLHSDAEAANVRCPVPKSRAYTDFEVGDTLAP